MILKIMAYVVIPIYTVLFAGRYPWFTTNFSVLGTFADRRLAFLVWGLLVGVYFHHALNPIISRFSGGATAYQLKNTALVMLAFAITTPYLPEHAPFRAFLHVIFAATAVVLLLLLLLILIARFYQESSANARPYLISVMSICIISILLLVLVGIVSSILEVFITVSVTLLVQKLLNVANKSDCLL